MPIRDALERYQAWLYLASILAGLWLGSASPRLAAGGEILVWPTLALLLYATFTQVPLTRLGNLVRDGRFLAALVTGNFLVMPVIVAALMWLVPADPAIRLGVLLVLLVPCTDWFISFTHQGQGDAARALAAAPVLLVLQLALLPLYLWLFMGSLAVELALGSHLVLAFGGLIVLPLVLAWGTERALEQTVRGAPLVRGLGRLPVPLLALVVFLIASSQVALVRDLQGVLGQVLLVFVLYLVAAALVGRGVSRLFRLEPRAGRTLVFSLGTRNSFVVLPLALTLPDAWGAVVVVVVFQSLVELFGMVAYLSWVPRWIQP